MIIGILGKGGSGKSTLSTLLAYAALTEKKSVLAIDADHNMDFAFNLSDVELPYYGSSLPDLKNYCGLSADADYRDIIRNKISNSFSAFPADPFTNKYSLQIHEHLRLMAAGPHTESILSDKSCSHVLFTPLKIFLPLLSISDNTVVIVDEKAGTDGAGTGIPTGFTVAVIVAEPTPYGIKSANQIAELLRHYETPFVCVLNKIRPGTDIDVLKQQLPGELVGTLPFDSELSPPSSEVANKYPIVKNIFSFAKNTLESHGDTRIQKTLNKFTKT